MISYPDTSFLCALYRRQVNAERASRFMAERSEPLIITSLLQFEFSQAVRFEAFRHRMDHTTGYSEQEGHSMLARFDLDVSRGVFVVREIMLADVLSRAVRLSEHHTVRRGRRSFDILHVASAASLGANAFLSFDEGQRDLATTEGLVVLPDLQ